MKNILPWINLVFVALLAIYVLAFHETKKAYVLNEKVFASFDGKKELEGKLNSLKKRNQQWLDSLEQLIQTGLRNDLVAEYQQSAERFQMEERDLSDRYTADIWKRLNQYMSEYGKDNGYEFIFGATGDGSLMYASENNNITEEVIQYVNKRYKEGD